MANHDIYPGGMGRRNANDAAYPSTISVAPGVPSVSTLWRYPEQAGYAQHTFARTYTPARALDTTPHNPSGGGEFDSALNEYFRNLPTPVVVGDRIRTCVLIQGTLLMNLYFKNLKAVPGFTFNVVLENAITGALLPVAAMTAINAATTNIDAGGNHIGVWELANGAGVIPVGGLVIPVAHYVTMEVTGVPAAGFAPTCGPGSIDMYLTPHVLDPCVGNA
jgi:hypothetical protein